VRTQPELVAKKFAAAVKKVEMMQTYFPAKDKEGLDASVLTGGVQTLVTLAMEKLMIPLKEELPSIVTQEFNTRVAAIHKLDPKAENLAVREIRETNCLAAVILVYYYLYWHIAIIKINSAIFSIFNDELDTDITNMLKSLPNNKQMLEYRYTSALFTHTNKTDAQWTELKKTIADLDVMPYTDNTTAFTKTKQNIAAGWFQGALSDTLGVYQKNKLDTQRSLSGSANALKKEFITRTADLFGGVFSTLQLYDETDVWKEMKRVTEIIAPHDKDSHQARYSSTLQRILKRQPYSADEETFEKNAYHLCTFHYAQVPLMLDICKTFAILHAFITDKAIDMSKIDKILTIKEDASTDLTAALGLPGLDRRPVTLFEDFVKETPNHARLDANKLTLATMTIEDVRGYHLFKSPINMDKCNHVFLACPFSLASAKDSYFPRIQFTLNGKTRKSEEWEKYVSPLLRNSFQVLYENKSMELLATKLKTNERAHQSRTTLNNLLQTIQYMKSQYQAVLERHSKAGRGRYHKYAGVSWPVRYIKTDNNPGDNYDAFDYEGPVPRIYRGDMVEVVENLVPIADAAKAFMAKAQP
jgi:hypothetical protein